MEQRKGQQEGQKHSEETEAQVQVYVPKWQKPQTQTEIYPVTEGNPSSHTKQAYKNSFNRFLRYIKIFDLQVLLDQGPDVLKQMIIKYVIFLRDERKSDLEFIPKHNIYKITVYGRSKNARHWMLCNFECYNAIQDYLEQRKRQGEGTIKGSSPLIREQCDPEDYIRIRSPRPMSYWNIRYLMNDVLKRSGVKTPEVMMSHAFRKNFETVCEESGMKALHSEMLVGHNIKIRKAYLRPKTSDVIEDYVTHAADELTISPEYRLRRENQELRSRGSEIWDQVRARVNELESRMHEFDRITNVRLEVVGEKHPDLRHQQQ